MGEDESPSASAPDYALVRLGRLSDGGPRYVETPADPTAADAPWPAEPWNTLTASLFILLALAWAWRLAGRYPRFPFLTACLPILLAGGVGGTFYHAFRTYRAFFYLDVIPISVLGLAGGVYLAVRLWRRQGWLYLGLALLLYIGFSAWLFRVIAPLPLWQQWSIRGSTIAVNSSYAALALVVLIPLGVMALRTRFRYFGWVACGLISFGIAWFFRLVDERAGAYLPMGTHWLWHTFGALATAAFIQYFYCLELEQSPSPLPIDSPPKMA